MSIWILFAPILALPAAVVLFALWKLWQYDQSCRRLDVLTAQFNRFAEEAQCGQVPDERELIQAIEGLIEELERQI